MAVVLHQFEFSHFSDKARWALAYKNVPHERISYFPGAHQRAIKKLSGQQQTPVLEMDGRVIAGSAAIIHYLEAQVPEPALYPADPERSRYALQIQSRFDAEIGPAVHAALFSALLRESGYLVNMFAGRASKSKRWAYRIKLPFAKRVIRKNMLARGKGVSKRQNLQTAFEIVERTLDAVGEEVVHTGYLVEDQFSVADLAAAALLAPFANLEHADMRQPLPVPARVQELQARFSGHAALQWVAQMYALHRPGNPTA